jgi:hypothetical protein
LAWILFTIPWLSGKDPTTTRLIYTAFWSLAMWAPGLGTSWRRVMPQAKPAHANLGRLGEKRAYLWAWLLPPRLAIATGLLHLPLEPGSWTCSSPYQAGHGHAPGAEAIPAWMVVAIQAVIA